MSAGLRSPSHHPEVVWAELGEPLGCVRLLGLLPFNSVMSLEQKGRLVHTKSIIQQVLFRNLLCEVLWDKYKKCLLWSDGCRVRTCLQYTVETCTSWFKGVFPEIDLTALESYLKLRYGTLHIRPHCSYAKGINFPLPVVSCLETNVFGQYCWCPCPKPSRWISIFIDAWLHRFLLLLVCFLYFFLLNFCVK